MDSLNLSDTEQRVQGFQSRIRSDYAAKIREVAKLTDEVAKWQTRLLDVEHENNVLRQQLVLARKEIVERKKGTTVITASTKVKASRTAATSTSEIPKLSLKRERSPSLEIVDMPKRSSKKLKGKERAERSLSLHSTTDCQIIASVEPASQPLQSARIPSVKAETMLMNTTNTTSYHYTEPTNTAQFPDSSRSRDSQNLIVDEEEISSSDSASPCSDDNDTDSTDESEEEPGIEHVSPLPDSAIDRYLQSIETLAIHPSPSNLHFQQKWAMRVLGQKQFDEYFAMRARIALRLASIIPMDDKDEEERIISEEVDSIKKDRGRPVSSDNIIAAFSDGDEEIDIVRVKCVQYDHAFADDLKSRFRVFKSVQPDRSKKSEEAPTSPTTFPCSTTAVSEDDNNVHTLVKKCQATTTS
ncbi:hypothetical protein BJ912DRAFT_1063501 [Pholiota molesta]|nr:hypothetical protein BJ912DRAFT_1063501 [Pholiota molesta]